MSERRPFVFDLWAHSSAPIHTDHLRISDKHSEGYITCNHFRRQMNQLRVFKISEEEFDALNRSYEGKVGGEIRFNYRRFCEDLQPTGPDAEVEFHLFLGLHAILLLNVS